MHLAEPDCPQHNPWPRGFALARPSRLQRLMHPLFPSQGKRLIRKRKAGAREQRVALKLTLSLPAGAQSSGTRHHLHSCATPSTGRWGARLIPVLLAPGNSAPEGTVSPPGCACAPPPSHCGIWAGFCFRSELVFKSPGRGYRSLTSPSAERVNWAMSTADTCGQHGDDPQPPPGAVPRRRRGAGKRPAPEHAARLTPGHPRGSAPGLTVAPPATFPGLNPYPGEAPNRGHTTPTGKRWETQESWSIGEPSQEV